MNTPALTREAIAQRIPHAGSMVLLDTVQSWSASTIDCLSYQHRARHNPLRENGVLSCITLVEFAAQAAALHASLSGEGITAQGTAYIGAIKALKLHAEQVPEVEALGVSAQMVLNERSGAIYQLSVAAEGELLMEARVVLVIPPS